MVCCEDEAVDLRHGFHWVVLNASAWETLAEGPLRSLLKYVAAGEEDGDALVADIAAAVRRANGNAVWRQKGLDMLTYIEDARIQAELIVEEGLGNAYNSGMEEGWRKGWSRASSRAKIASELWLHNCWRRLALTMLLRLRPTRTAATSSFRNSGFRGRRYPLVGKLF